MKKEQLQYEIEYFTGQKVSLESLGEKETQEAEAFTKKLLGEITVMSTDQMLSHLRYQKHLYYNQKFNM